MENTNSFMKQRTRGFASLVLTIVLSLSSGALLLTAPVTMPACNQADVAASLRDADVGAQNFLAFAKQTYPIGDKRISRIQLFADNVHVVAVEYPNLTDAEGQLKLLPTLNLALTMFHDEILPLMKLSPTQILIAYGIDTGLRIAANHFITHANALIAASRAAQTASAGTKAKATANEAGVDVSSINVDAELAKAKAFLATPKVKKP